MRLLRIILSMLTIALLVSVEMKAAASSPNTNVTPHIDVSLNGDIITVETSSTVPSGTTVYEPVIKKYKSVAQGIAGICTITCLIYLLINISKLGAVGDNQRDRQKALKGILLSGISVAMFGGLSVVVLFFWNLLTGGTTGP